YYFIKHYAAMRHLRRISSPNSVCSRYIMLRNAPANDKGLVSKLTNVREWLENHETFGAVLIVAIGLLVRLWAATDTFLDPDEALHYMQANQTSLQLAYKASLNVVHPPL